jgi:hypothetical protein
MKGKGPTLQEKIDMAKPGDTIVWPVEPLKYPATQDIKNVVDNLSNLSECFMTGEDYCSVAIIEGAIDLIREMREGR